MQSRLEDVSSIHSALALTSTYEGVDLVDEEDDLAFALRDFGDDGLQTFFKFAPYTSHQRSGHPYRGSRLAWSGGSQGRRHGRYGRPDLLR